MTKRTRIGRKQSCKTSCLACTFFSICKLLLDKKRKKKKKKIVAIRESFFPCKWSVFWFTRNSSQKLLFVEVFVKNFAIFWSRESFCSWKFLPLKYDQYFPSFSYFADFAGHVVRDKRAITSLSLSWKITTFRYCNSTFTKGKNNNKFLSPSNH